MTREDIPEMVREAREQTMKELPPNTFDLDLFHERFATLVAAQEREACAYRAGIALLGADRGLSNRVDQAIRARGQA
jgi:hypothetical protein